MYFAAWLYCLSLFLTISTKVREVGSSSKRKGKENEDTKTTMSPEVIYHLNYQTPPLVTLPMYEDNASQALRTHAKLTEVQTKRIQLVEQECKKYYPLIKLQDPKDVIPNLIVDDKHKTLFCAIPKVASSNWKRVFIDAINSTGITSSSIRDVHDRHLLPNLRDFSESDQNYRLRQYFKIIFIRNPFERLLSAYRNKIEGKKVESVVSKTHVLDERGRKRTRIEKMMRVKTAKRAGGSYVLQENDTLSFNHFIAVLTDPAFRIRHYNTHWKSFFNLCHPCVVRYDLIGKMESFGEDLDTVRDVTDIAYGHWFDKDTRRTVTEVMERYYKTVDPTLMKRLLQIYDVDMKMFGYAEIPSHML